MKEVTGNAKNGRIESEQPTDSSDDGNEGKCSAEISEGKRGAEIDKLLGNIKLSCGGRVCDNGKKSDDKKEGKNGKERNNGKEKKSDDDEWESNNSPQSDSDNSNLPQSDSDNSNPPQSDSDNSNLPQSDSDASSSSPIYSIQVREWNKTSRFLSHYKGKTLLIVNVASNCGLAKAAYEELSGLDAKYFRKGLRILLFPCRQFLNQEFQEISKIKEFISQFGSNFILMDYVNVKGNDISPLYKYLISNTKGFLTNGIKWNFTYFLIGPDGKIVRRYGPTEHVHDDEGSEIQKCLKRSKGDKEKIKNMKVEPDDYSSEF